ncbi:MAG TPA: XRE family transcriptional regulator [Terriglobales bacterium]|nr:XRE family transcriptional regulator [Terriglobales bacterium]
MSGMDGALGCFPFKPTKFADQRLLDTSRPFESTRDPRNQRRMNAFAAGYARVNSVKTPVEFGPSPMAGRRVIFGVTGDDLHKYTYISAFIRNVKEKVQTGAKLAKPDWADRLTAVRKRVGGNQASFGQRLGVSQVTVSNWEAGRITPAAENFLKIGQIAGDPDCWYFWQLAGLDRDAMDTAMTSLGKKVHPQSLTILFEPAPGALKAGSGNLKKIPDAVAIPLLKDAAAAGSPRTIQERDIEDMMILPRKWVPRPDHATCIKVMGDSMSPILDDGDIVVIDTSVRDRSKLYGKMVAAVSPDGGVTIKWLRKSGKSEMLVPQHTSPRHQIVVISDDPEWEIIGRVCWRMGRVP